MPGLIPSLGSNYRTTTGAFKWIVLGVVLGAVIMYFVFREAVRESDEIYEKSGMVPPKTNEPAANH